MVAETCRHFATSSSKKMRSPTRIDGGIYSFEPHFRSPHELCFGKLFPTKGRLKEVNISLQYWT